MSVLTTEMILKRSRKTNLNDVKQINFFGYSLSDISAISQCKSLESASFSGCRITSLKCFQNMPNLRELSIAQNNISDPGELVYLSSCENLKLLWLKGNPISKLPNYRSDVIGFVSNLSKLDDKEITNNERQLARSNFSNSNVTNEKSYPIYQNDRNNNINNNINNNNFNNNYNNNYNNNFNNFNNNIYERNDMKNFYKKNESAPISNNKNYITKKGNQKFFLGGKKTQKTQRGFTPDNNQNDRYNYEYNFNVNKEEYNKPKNEDKVAQNYYQNSGNRNNNKLYKSIDEKKVKRYYINTDYNNPLNNNNSNQFNSKFNKTGFNNNINQFNTNNQFNNKFNKTGINTNNQYNNKFNKTSFNNNRFNNKYVNPEYNNNRFNNKYANPEYNNNQFNNNNYDNYDNYDNRDMYEEKIEKENKRDDRYSRQMPNVAQSYDKNANGVSSTNGQQGIVDCISMLLKRLTNDELLYIKDHIDQKISKY